MDHRIPQFFSFCLTRKKVNFENFRNFSNFKFFPKGGDSWKSYKKFQNLTFFLAVTNRINLFASYFDSAIDPKYFCSFFPHIFFSMHHFDPPIFLLSMSLFLIQILIVFYFSVRLKKKSLQRQSEENRSSRRMKRRQRCRQ